MNAPQFGRRDTSTREDTIHERARTCLLVARDMKHGSTVLICRRVISALRMGQPPRLSDVRSVQMALREYFR